MLIKLLKTINEKKYFLFFKICGFIIIQACTPISDDVIARVGSNYLYKSDLDSKFGYFDSIDDSLLKVRNHIDTWARKKILFQLALINLSDDKIQRVKRLVDDYESDVYASIYKESILIKSLDTIIPKRDVETFFNENKEIFKLNESLYRVRLVQFPQDNVDKNNIKKSFIRHNEEDLVFLNSLSFQFSKTILNDSIWITENALLKEVDFLNHDNLNLYVKKSSFFEVKDSLEVYLFYVIDYKKRGETAPLSHVITTVKNIITNQRKLKFFKKFDREIIQDAIQSKKIELY
jgi:hypothetical protein